MLLTSVSSPSFQSIDHGSRSSAARSWLVRSLKTNCDEINSANNELEMHCRRRRYTKNRKYLPRRTSKFPSPDMPAAHISLERNPVLLLLFVQRIPQLLRAQRWGLLRANQGADEIDPLFGKSDPPAHRLAAMPDKRCASNQARSLNAKQTVITIRPCRRRKQNIKIECTIVNKMNTECNPKLAEG